jgi:uncharacterized protein YggU (UPF0235/DUF167 family)
MIFEIRVKAGAKANSIKQIAPRLYAVSVKETPRDGKANVAIIKIMARELGVAAGRLRMKVGGKSRHKLIEFI